MKKYFNCQECNGRGNLLHKINGVCDIVQIDANCPSCNGTGHLPLEDMIMSVVKSLVNAWEGMKTWHGPINIANINSLLAKNVAMYQYEKHFVPTRLEYLLATAVLMLEEIAEIEGVELKNNNWNCPESIKTICSFTLHGSFNLAHNAIHQFATHHKIDLDAHIAALMEYRG